MNIKKPTIIQAFDYYVDREYYKTISKFFFTEERKVRADRLTDSIKWVVESDKVPDEILFNGAKYKLTKMK